MALDVIGSFKRAVLGVLGIAEDRPIPPIDRLALYRATVQVCASDGSTVDVKPEASHLEPMQGVRVRVGIPGAQVVVSPGAKVLIGWEDGDPSAVYAVPSWESGATVTKLVVKATQLYLGDESGADALVTKTEFNAHTHKYNPGPSAPVESLVPSVPAVGTTKVKAV